MPTYVYRCAKCGDDIEVYQTFSEEPLKRHDADGGKLTKVLSPVGIVLKGSGFYKNDSGSGSRRNKARDESSSNGDSSSSSDSNGSDSKTSDSKGSDSTGSGDSSKSTADNKSSEKKNDQKSGAKKSPVKSA